MRDEKLQEFIDSIPMDDLFDEIRRVLYIPELKFDYETYPSSDGSEEVDISSQNILPYMPTAVSFLFKEMLVGSNPFSTKIIKERRYGYYIFKGGIELTCYSRSGSSYESREFMDFSYSEQYGWRFNNIKGV